MIQSELLARIPGIIHGFGDRAQPIPKNCELKWLDEKPVWKQVHGVSVATVSAPRSECGDVDALLAVDGCSIVGVVTADCVPILMAKKEGTQIAAIHAGWRGTFSRITEQVVRRFEGQGDRASDWVAAIGPAIGGCCYQVSEDLANQFQNQFGIYHRESYLKNHRMLNLPELNRNELLRLGVAEVELLPYCTRCLDRFHSYRREGSGVRQYSIIQKTSSVPR